MRLEFIYPDVTPEEIRSLYWDKKLSTPEIARIYDGINVSDVHSFLKRNGIPLRELSEYTRLSTIRRQQKRLRELAEEKGRQGMSAERDRFLALADAMLPEVANERPENKKGNLADVDPEEIRKLYWDEGFTVKKLARKYHVGTDKLLAFMKEHLIEIRPSATRISRQIAEKLDPEMVKKWYWEDGLSVADVSKKTGVCGDNIYSFMRRNNIKIRSHSEAAKLSYTKNEVVKIPGGKDSFQELVDTIFPDIANQKPTTTRGKAMEKLEQKAEQAYYSHPIYKELEELKQRRAVLEQDLVEKVDQIRQLDEEVRSTNILKYKKKEIAKAKLNVADVEKQGLDEEIEEVDKKISVALLNKQKYEIGLEVTEFSKNMTDRLNEDINEISKFFKGVCDHIDKMLK